MKRIVNVILVLCAVVVQAQAQERDPRIYPTLRLIERVNTIWQSTHSPEVRAFWDEAAYHTGNVEAYLLLSKEPGYEEKAQKMLNFSRIWAEHNRFQGATEPDTAKWEYKTYGEDQQHVLFADWQTCFQVYLDLYRIDEDSAREARAKMYQHAAEHGIHVDLPEPKHYRFANRAWEVMGYMASHPAHDYWWWADALYMAMPVMTKMHKLSYRDIYLDKLYENLLYTDSIMYDEETGLYFRDGKYVYPKHKTASGKKDFWARGDGWVLAGLAKVLQDVPKGWEHYDFFKEKFQRMAKAVAELQQPEGYWTRSMMDPDQAPGPETSGTAFFTYGILWGINHWLLDKEEFEPVVERAWRYLSETAVQADGTVGYVQPIGERAIPGQQVDGHSTANFGTGAFLLAASEYVRFLKGAWKKPERRRRR